MKLSISYLGPDSSQIPPAETYGNNGVEAFLIERDHLVGDEWLQSWKNILTASRIYGPENVTFHFPVNNSDYVEDPFVRARVLEGYQRACDNGLAGFIIHSNRTRDRDDWVQFDQAAERERVISILASVRDSQETNATWLALENMPFVGNHGGETDPLFSAVEDFEGLPPNIGIVWDVCHAKGSEQYIAALKEGRLPSTIFARSYTGLTFDPVRLSNIAHWHFAASKGLNNPDTGETCFEGVLPSEADVPETIYSDELKKIVRVTGEASAINFEVQEADYRSRQRAPAIIAWANSVLST